MKKNKLFEDYYKLKEMAEVLDNKIKETGKLIVEVMEAEGKKEVAKKYGTFAIRERTNWKYNDDVKDMIASIQNTAQERGDATKTTTKFVTLTKPNEEKENKN